MEGQQIKAGQNGNNFHPFHLAGQSVTGSTLDHILIGETGSTGASSGGVTGRSEPGLRASAGAVGGGVTSFDVGLREDSPADRSSGDIDVSLAGLNRLEEVAAESVVSRLAAVRDGVVNG